MKTRTSTSLPFSEQPVAAGNYDTARSPIDLIVLHTEVGFKAGTRIHFNTPPERRASRRAGAAQYAVNMDGTVDHFLEEYLNAYHAGNYAVNKRSIGIEHEDYGNPQISRSNALYEASAKLVADICQFYAIPVDRQHIVAHNEVSESATSCPGSLDVNRIVAMAKQLSGGEASPLPYSITISGPLGANIRGKATTPSPVTGKLSRGQKFTPEGWVKGELYQGNDKWWQLKGQMSYIWSGATDNVPKEIVHSDNLVLPDPYAHALQPTGPVVFAPGAGIVQPNGEPVVQPEPPRLTDEESAMLLLRKAKDQFNRSDLSDTMIYITSRTNSFDVLWKRLEIDPQLLVHGGDPGDIIYDKVIQTASAYNLRKELDEKAVNGLALFAKERRSFVQILGDLFGINGREEVKG